MTMIYAILKFLFFPATYVKGFWEQFTCKILGLPVETSNYLAANEMCGHVDHALPKNPSSAFLMAIGPSVMNLFIGSSFFGAGYMLIFEMGIGYYESRTAFVLGVFMLYLGISFFCNIFPTVEDAMNLYDVMYSQKKGNIIGRIFAFIPTALLYAGAYLERYCVTSILWIVLVVAVSILNKYAFI